MVDSYHHRRVVYDDWSGAGIKLLDEKGKVFPQLAEVLRICADQDLILASGHYPYSDTKVVMEEAKRVGVKRMEIIHPAHIHSKTLISEMKEAASEGIKLMLSGLGTTTFPLHETGPVYAVRIIKEVGADHLVYGSDYGQVHNPTHLVGTEWTIKLLLAYGATKEEIKKVFQTTPARTPWFVTLQPFERVSHRRRRGHGKTIFCRPERCRQTKSILCFQDNNPCKWNALVQHRPGKLPLRPDNGRFCLAFLGSRFPFQISALE